MSLMGFVFATVVSFVGTALAGSATLEKVGYEMVRVQPGEFTMGDPEARSSDVFASAHPVRITQPFYIGTTEVTRQLWIEVMGKKKLIQVTDAGDGYKALQINGLLGGADRKKLIGACKEMDCPILGPNWYDAVRFLNRLSELDGFEPVYTIREPTGSCSDEQRKVTTGPPCDPVVSWNQNANGYRLATEAEHAYAAHAGGDTRYAGSDDFVAVAGEKNRINRVAQFQANSWGLYDMSGNLWEWVWDWYGPLPSKGVTNPTGPSGGRSHQEKTGQIAAMKTARGGSLAIIPLPLKMRKQYGEIWERQFELPWCPHTDNIGIRVARTAD